MQLGRQGKKSPKLPRLRSELSLQRGAVTREGNRGWMIYDPVQHRYFQIDETSFELLSLWPEHSDADQLIAAASERFGSRVDKPQIEEFVTFLQTNCLVADAPSASWRYYAGVAERAANARGPFTQLAHNYLFFRVPLFRPQRFLNATLALAAPFYSRAFAIVVMLLGVTGLYLVSRQWDEFLRTTDFLFSWEGAFYFALSLIFVKALHELGHAYTAVRYGCFVPTMGVAFMMLTPLLYTDVTDSWKLRDRRQRLSIDAAGIVVELAVACIATFLWTFLPDGPLRSVAFLLATAGWIMSLAINLNPFMRFDGYYLLSELVGIENLQSRAFAIGRWRMREILFGLGRPCPEPFSTALINTLTVWAWATWLYRLALFIGIALLVYTYCFKVLGIVLFILEIVFLIAQPVLSELKEWYAARDSIAKSRRTAITVACGLAFGALLVVPWSGSVQVPAVVQMASTQTVHAPRAARIEAVHVAAGQFVNQGDTLFTLKSDELANQIRLVETELRLIRLRLGRRNVDAIDREESLVLQRSLLALTTKRNGLAVEQQELLVKAPLSGRVLEMDLSIQPGRWINRREQMALLGKPAQLEATGYLREDDVWRVQAGASGRFIPDASMASAVDVRLRDVAITSSKDLAILSLTSAYGGSIAVERNADDELVPNAAQYLAKFDLASNGLNHSALVRGVIHLDGKPESILARFWRRGLGVLVRESGA